MQDSDMPPMPTLLERVLVEHAPWIEITSDFLLLREDDGYPQIVLKAEDGYKLTAQWPGEIAQLITLAPGYTAVISISGEAFDRVGDFDKWMRKNRAEYNKYLRLKAKFEVSPA